MRYLPFFFLLAACPPTAVDTTPDDTDPVDTDGFNFDTDLGGECGDGIVDDHLGEVCDDQNTIAGDGCRADCLGVEECGDGLLDDLAGEACDEGEAVDCLCDAYCTVPTECGDVCCNTGEVCDGNGGCMFGVAEEVSEHNPVSSIYAASPDNIWVGGTQAQLYRWEGGTEWTQETLVYYEEDAGTIVDMFGFETVQGFELWMVSPQTGIVQLDEVGDYHPSTNLNIGGGSRNAIAAIDQKHVYAVGDNGAFNTYDGKDWTYHSEGATWFEAVWGYDPVNIYAVGVASFDGGDSRIVHFDDDDDVFNTVYTTVETTLLDVWGADEDHVWAIGTGGWVLQWDGAAWIKQDIGSTEDLSTIHGKDANNVLVGGDDGGLYRYDGTSWSSVYTNRTKAIQDIWALDNGKDIVILEDGDMVRSVW
jgi:cysteine-rich repeat protein